MDYAFTTKGYTSSLMDIDKEHIKKQIREWVKQGYVMPEAIPRVELYAEQVTTFMDRYLSGYKRSADDKTLTRTMINNYTKNNLLPPPVKKRYNADHIILLIIIYYMKNVISIGDIKSLFEPLLEEFYSDSSEAKNATPLMDMYESLYKLEKKQYFETEKSILKTLELSETDYPEKDNEYLKNFIFLSLLGYDIFTKRKVMEHLIDEMNKGREDTDI